MSERYSKMWTWVKAQDRKTLEEFVTWIEDNTMISIEIEDEMYLAGDVLAAVKYMLEQQ